MPPIVLADLVATLTTLTAIAAVVVGVADRRFRDGSLYGMEAGAGCSHGLAGTANTLIRVHADASITPVADVSANCADPSRRHPDADSFALDGTWYGSIAVRGAFHVTEPNHQKLDRITPDSTITRVVDLCMRWGSPAIWQGPTGIVYHGHFSVGTLDTFPV